MKTIQAMLEAGINNTMEMVQYALKKGIIRIEN